MSLPAVSICVPVYNGARFIGETLASVLAQVFKDFEVVVVDNASTDETVAIVERIQDARIRIVKNAENIGAVRNWTRALGLGRGPLIKLLCADDTLHPECLSLQVNVMDRHDGLALVAGQRDVVNEGGRVLLAARGLAGLDGVVDGKTAVRATVRSGTNIFGEPATVLMRRSLTEACGPFSGRWPYMIDLEYWCRMLRLGSLYALRQSVGTFRVVGDSWSVELGKQQSRQAIELFRELHRVDPSSVRSRDVAVGATRSVALAAGRGLSYRWLSRSMQTSGMEERKT